LPSSACNEVFQKTVAVTGTLSQVRQAHTLSVQIIHERSLEFTRCH
jgi:hypothetical protein